MQTRFQIPRVLHRYSAGQAEFSLSGTTVGALLVDLRRQFPDVYRCVCDETGAVRQHINLFVNNEILNRQTCSSRRLRNDDVVSVFQAVSGG